MDTEPSERSPRRILVIDDSDIIRGCIAMALESSGSELVEAPDLATARKCLSSSQFDAVILDVELPDGDGVSLIPTIASLQEATRVVVITGHATMDHAIHALRAGAYDFLTKPFDDAQLVATVGRAVESKMLEASNRRLSSELEAANRDLERRVLERTNELDRALRELEESRDRVIRAEKLASLGTLIAGIAHEINNPLSFVGSNIREVRKELEATPAPIEHLDEIVEMLDEAEDGTRRISKIVSDLRGYTRKSSGSAKLVDLNECVASALNLTRGTVVRPTIEARPAQIPKVHVDPDEITQVLVNLLVNASHATEGQGRIRVETSAGPENVAVRVSDDGCGIPPQNLARIFDPFFTTKDPGKGTGLGLSISHEIVQRHGGTIAVRSEVGKGTTFEVRFPAARSHAEGPERVASA